MQRISEQARPYPAHLLTEGGSGLCLFSAAFLGWNDAIHMARKGMTTTCVDIDGPRLREMQDIYPDDWTFTIGDAWDFALDARRINDMWDAVSVDTFTGEAEDLSLRSLPLWTSVAGRMVTVTCSKGRSQGVTIPPLWTGYLFERSSDVNWLVLIHD